MQWCGRCNSRRKGPFCWKCGNATYEAARKWSNPRLPSASKVRELAREVGYAIGEHGSKERDLDLIAAPWTDDAVSPDELIGHLCSGLNAIEVGRSQKPLGRIAVSLQIDGWFRTIDLSICPAVLDSGGTEEYN
jgi:hypothetical protein